MSDATIDWDSVLRRAASNDDIAGIDEALANGARLNPYSEEDLTASESVTALRTAAFMSAKAATRHLLFLGATPSVYEWLRTLEPRVYWLLDLLLEFRSPLEGYLSSKLHKDVKWARSVHCPPLNPKDWQRDDTTDFLNVILLHYGSVPYLRILRHPTALERGLLTPSVLDSGLLCASYMGKTEAVEPLLELGADVNAVTPYGRTALHLAASAGQWREVKILIGRGADPDRPASDRSTPLLIALLNKHRRVASALVKSGADLRPKIYGEDAEAIAAAQGMNRVLREIQARKQKIGS